MTRAVLRTSVACLEAAWERSDKIFSLLVPEAIRARPIPLRQPFLFYVGHLPAFAWNQLARGAAGHASFGKKALHPPWPSSAKPFAQPPAAAGPTG